MQHGLLLNRVFSRNVWRGLIEGSDREAFAAAMQACVPERADKSNRQLVEEMYGILRKSYRNEYFYKNTLLNKLLLGVHKPTTTTALTELGIGKAKADFVLINGRATVYEIKTELDNLERMASQIEHYYQAFSQVCIVAGETHLEAIRRRWAGSTVGIIVLTNKDTLRELQKPQDHPAGLDAAVMFGMLRKAEFEQLLLRQCGELPAVSQFDYYRTCKRMLTQLNPDVWHADFIRVLKQRHSVEVELYRRVPYALKFLAYFLELKRDDYERMEAFLEEKEGWLCTSPT
ncbi:hypothetical protein PA598K_05952 [Paenibacillus sp. 598K]|uniref:sce7726 family protein n=1 Tax=Paenibacillus sp. 598K TaxID=1117987 RepID=UPI000FF974DB|nr:sce7726 family protein [Paenibacillus sp. 598K]GBF77403.1 hypothetical protein PA598K_05952 [Paenibacillus sp. 598K]